MRRRVSEGEVRALVDHLRPGVMLTTLFPGFPGVTVEEAAERLAEIDWTKMRPLFDDERVVTRWPVSDPDLLDLHPKEETMDESKTAAQGVARYDTPNPDLPTREVPGELDSLIGQLSYLSDRVDLLGTRMSPVLRQHEPSPIDSVQEIESLPNTEVGARIRVTAKQAGAIAYIVNDLLDRLEV